MTYEIKNFDPASTKPHRIWMFIGGRGTGKTNLMMDILYRTHKRYDLGMAMTATTSTVKKLEKIIPSRLIHKNGYDFEVADKMLSKCKELVSKGKSRNVLIIQDDVMFEKGVLKSKTQRELHFNGRHAFTTQMSTTQYCMDIPSSIRGNIDYVFALRENTIANKKKLYEFFFGSFPSFKEFDRVFNKCTANYGALVIDKTKPASSINDSIFHYTAEINLPKFDIGRSIFFKMSNIIDSEVEETKNSSVRGNSKMLKI